MSFLDNSGDIILDAVLTDTGRMRMARGDGSFRIVKFALGDDEINYARYQLNHPSGSAYADLEILQTPVLEAFTNNYASMGSKLITIPRDNILFLPIIEINDVFSNSTRKNPTKNSFIIAVNNATEQEYSTDSSGVSIDGILFGEDPTAGGNMVRLDQGLDTTQISPTRVLDPLLVETTYLIEIDSRLGSIVSVGPNSSPAPLAFLDDDFIATYTVSLGVDRSFVRENSDTTNNANQSISGPRGTILEFKVLSSLELNTSNYLFTTLGNSTETLTGRTGVAKNIYSIDTVIRVTGATTGNRIDVPVKFIKLQ